MKSAWEIYLKHAGDCYRRADMSKEDERIALLREAEVWVAKAETMIELQSAASNPAFHR
jgi:hypothetical protein